MTIQELAETIQHVVVYQGQIVFDASKLDDSPRKLMDVERLRQSGWTNKTNLLAGLAISCAEFANLGIGKGTA